MLPLHKLFESINKSKITYFTNEKQVICKTKSCVHGYMNFPLVQEASPKKI